MNAETFAASARRLAGLAGVAFGWRPHEFWAATPFELGDLIAALAGGPAAEPPPDATIKQLMERFPDER